LFFVLTVVCSVFFFSASNLTHALCRPGAIGTPAGDASVGANDELDAHLGNMTADNLHRKDLLLANAYDVHEQAKAQLKLAVAKRKKHFITAELYHDLRLSVFGLRDFVTDFLGKDEASRKSPGKYVCVGHITQDMVENEFARARRQIGDGNKPNSETSSRWDSEEGDSRSSNNYGARGK
jgi:hypothetical protein